MIQRLNLTPPEPDRASKPASESAATALPLVPLDPAKVQEVERRTKEIIASGAAPEWIFLCGRDREFVTFQYAADKKPAMLLFTSPFAARDYLRVMNVSADVGHVGLADLPEFGRSWTASGSGSFILNRCPRCRHFLLGGIEMLLSKEHFVAVWAADRASRSVQGEILVRSAMAYMSKSEHAQARANLETIRDHLDCGIPYVHQMIGLIAGIQQDATGKAGAVERLKEFGPQFDGATDFSPQVLATATVGLMMNFGLMPQPGTSGAAGPAPTAS